MADLAFQAETWTGWPPETYRRQPLHGLLRAIGARIEHARDTHPFARPRRPELPPLPPGEAHAAAAAQMRALSRPRRKE